MLEVRDQVRLPFRRMLEVCLDSIYYRLLRSVVTVVIIVLAIAFLATIMTEGYLGHAIRDAVTAKTQRLTAFSRFLRQVSLVGSDDRLATFYAGVKPERDSAVFENLRGWGGFANADAARQFLARSRAVDEYLRFFDDIPSGQRALLVEAQRGVTIFDWLQDQDHFTLFAKNLDRMRQLRLPSGLAEFKTFLGEWPAYRRELGTVKTNYNKTVAQIAAMSREKDLPNQLIEAANQDRLKPFFDRLAGCGFHTDTSQWPDIVAGVRYEAEVNWAFDILRRKPVRTSWNRKFQEKFNPGMALIQVASHPSRIDWIRSALVEQKEDQSFNGKRFLAIAQEYGRRTRLLQAEQHLLNRYGYSEKLSEKTVWLMSVSFLVCVVGIANAMLMSVLERFKEIATMKCLGARNGTIGFLFVTESTIIGIIGGVIGIFVGILIVFVRQGIQYPGQVFANVPWLDLGWTFLLCFMCSLLLASIAAIYPARVAARMAPMEAMRVD